MKPPVQSIDFLDITYQDQPDILVGRWMRPVTEAEARHGYEALLAAAHRHKARYWLLDIRRRHRSSPAILTWLLDSYYGQLVRELGTPMCVAYFMAPGLRGEFLQDGTVPEPATYQGQPFRMNQTITETEAVAWLREQQTQPA